MFLWNQNVSADTQHLLLPSCRTLVLSNSQILSYFLLLKRYSKALGRRWCLDEQHLPMCLQIWKQTWVRIPKRIEKQREAIVGWGISRLGHFVIYRNSECCIDKGGSRGTRTFNCWKKKSPTSHAKFVNQRKRKSQKSRQQTWKHEVASGNPQFGPFHVTICHQGDRTWEKPFSPTTLTLRSKQKNRLPD